MNWTDAITKLAEREGRLFSEVDDRSKQLWTSRLRTAIDVVWTEPAHLIWPWIADVATLTLEDGSFDWGDVDSSSAMTVWRSDPRGLPGAEYLRLTYHRLGDTVTPVGYADLTSVVVFYRTAAPAWAWDDEETQDDEVPDQIARAVIEHAAAANALRLRESQQEGTTRKLMNVYESALTNALEDAALEWRNSPWLSVYA